MNFAATRAAPRLALAALSLAVAAPVVAQNDDAAVEAVDEESDALPDPEIAQAFADAQACAVVLNKLGGDANAAKAEIHMEKARQLAVAAGFASAEAFKTSYDEWVEIINMASAEEMAAFTANCQATG